MYAIQVRYLGPTANRGTRIAYKAHGYPRWLTRRAYEENYEQQLRRDAEDYAREVLGIPAVTVLGVAYVSARDAVVLVNEGAGAAAGL